MHLSPDSLLIYLVLSAEQCVPRGELKATYANPLLVTMNRKVAVLPTLVLIFAIITPFFSTALGSANVNAAEVISQDSWASRANLHDARSGLGTVVLNGKIYAIGGAGNQGFQATNEEFDIATNTWTVKTSMPTPRSSFGIAVYQNKIYCMGGFVPGGATGVNEVYDPATDSWETKASMPTPSENINANLVEGKIYVIGGTNATLNQVYDPANDSWTTKASVPTGVSGYASAVIGDKIYIFTTGLTQIYDVQNDSWSRGTPAPSPVVLPAAGATTGVYAPERIYIFGANAQEPYWELFTKGFIIQSYDPKTDTWTNGTMPSGRYSVSVAVVDDLLYVIGGFTTAFSTDKFDLNPTIAFSSLNQQYAPIGYGTEPPKISIISPPENANYTSSNVSLAFTANKPLSWQGYSLDGQEITAIVGNVTLADIPSGPHNLTVFASDSFGNNVTSQTVTFSVLEPEKSTATFTVAAIGSGATASIVCVGALFYLKKRKTQI